MLAAVHTALLTQNVPGNFSSYDRVFGINVLYMKLFYVVNLS